MEIQSKYWWLFLTLELVLSTLNGVSIYLFLKHRNKQPIRGRYPYWSAAFHGLIWLYVSLTCIRHIFIFDFPCWWNTVQSHIGGPLLLNFVLVRTWKLYFDYNLSEEVAARPPILQSLNRRRSSTSSEKEIRQWYIKNKHLKSTSYVWKVLAILVCFHAITPIAFMISLEIRGLAHIGSQDPRCDRLVVDLILAAMIGIYVGFIFFVRSRLKEVKDGLYIKSELRFMALAACFGTIPWFVWVNIPAAKDVEKEIAGSTLYLLLWTTVVLYVGIIFPYMKCRDNEDTIRQSSPSFQATLIDLHKMTKDAEEAVLADPSTPEYLHHALAQVLSQEKGVIALMDFLKLEFSVENLLFLQTCDHYINEATKSLYDVSDIFWDPEHVTEHAHRVYEEFVSSESPLCVNISGTVRAGIQKTLVQFPLTKALPIKRASTGYSELGLPGFMSAVETQELYKVDMTRCKSNSSHSEPEPDLHSPLPIHTDSLDSNTHSSNTFDHIPNPHDSNLPDPKPRCSISSSPAPTPDGSAAPTPDGSESELLQDHAIAVEIHTHRRRSSSRRPSSSIPTIPEAKYQVALERDIHIAIVEKRTSGSASSRRKSLSSPKSSEFSTSITPGYEGGFSNLAKRFHRLTPGRKTPPVTKIHQRVVPDAKWANLRKMYDEARWEILNLITNDSFVRFLQSDLYRRYSETVLIHRT